MILTSNTIEDTIAVEIITIAVEIITIGHQTSDIRHQTFEDQLACLSDQNMFASDIKDWSKVYKPLFIHVTYSVYVSYKNITPGC